jgi:lysophospholipase L1-like esterase
MALAFCPTERIFHQLDRRTMNSTPPQIPVAPFPLGRGLPNLHAKLTSGELTRIVALGSSTTAGEGGIVPYPPRLEMMLRESFPARTIDVLNRGIGGEEAPKEQQRLQKDVIAEHPCLVIWQIGTNSVYQSAADNPPSQAVTIAALRAGIEEIERVGGIDIILMDLQFLPAVLTPATRDAADNVVRSIAAVADDMKVNLFRRYQLMHDWHHLAKFSFNQMVDPKDPARLHQSEWATQSVSNALLNLIVEELKRAGPV